MDTNILLLVLFLVATVVVYQMYRNNVLRSTIFSKEKELQSLENLKDMFKEEADNRRDIIIDIEEGYDVLQEKVKRMKKRERYLENRIESLETELAPHRPSVKSGRKFKNNK